MWSAPNQYWSCSGMLKETTRSPWPFPRNITQTHQPTVHQNEFASCRDLSLFREQAISLGEQLCWEGPVTQNDDCCALRSLTSRDSIPRVCEAIVTWSPAPADTAGSTTRRGQQCADLVEVEADQAATEQPVVDAPHVVTQAEQIDGVPDERVRGALLALLRAALRGARARTLRGGRRTSRRGVLRHVLKRDQ